MSPAEMTFNKSLERVSRAGAEQIKIETLTDLSWDKVCVIGIYEGSAFRDGDERRFFASALKKYPWVGSEGDWGLVFVEQGGGSIHAMRRPRKTLDRPSAIPLSLSGKVKTELPKCLVRSEATLFFL